MVDQTAGQNYLWRIGGNVSEDTISTVLRKARKQAAPVDFREDLELAMLALFYVWQNKQREVPSGDH